MDGLFNGQPIYNELDAHACAWLRRLVTAGQISRGRVVERDIRELDSADIGRGRRFHAFAGIGLWDHALALASWPPELAIWTGSCPCQPFSVAGKGRGTSDERHLWPSWFRLIRECAPPIIFGEQVASPAGRAWFDVVSADLESVGYAVGAADLCSAGVGAPHLRQRLFFVAHSQEVGRRERRALRRWGAEGVREKRNAGILGYAGGEGGGRDGRAVPDAQGEGAIGGETAGYLADEPQLAGYTRGFWADAEWVLCRDGKARPVEPGSFPLAHGVAGRVAVVRPGEQAGAAIPEPHWYNRSGALKCIGNAIVPQLAAVFAEAALRSIHDEFV